MNSGILSKTQYFAVITFLIILTAYTAFEVYDELSDLDKGESPLTIWVEILIVTSSFGFFIYLSLQLYKNKCQHKELSESLQSVTHERDSSQQLLQQGREAVHATIQGQFDEWNFTDAQRDVALLLLKGMGAKEIADARNTSEKTVRNHLSGIYEKSGLSGARTFCAWFYKELF